MLLQYLMINWIRPLRQKIDQIMQSFPQAIWATRQLQEVLGTAWHYQKVAGRLKW